MAPSFGGIPAERQTVRGQPFIYFLEALRFLCIGAFVSIACGCTLDNL
jgi:hypothetical protein